MSDFTSLALGSAFGALAFAAIILRMYLKSRKTGNTARGAQAQPPTTYVTRIPAAPKEEPRELATRV